jgi:hypothetical protein
VPRKETQGAKDYVKRKVRQAVQRGAKKIDSAARAYAGMSEPRLPRVIKDANEVWRLIQAAKAAGRSDLEGIRAQLDEMARYLRKRGYGRKANR